MSVSHRLILLLGCLCLVTACGPAQAGAAPTANPSRASSGHRLAPPLPSAYAALGASETYGTGARPRTKGYAYLVAHALHAHPFVDEGIPGTTLDAAYQTELGNALAIRPHLCTAFFGFNDLRNHVPRAAFLQDLHDLVATLRRAHCQVLIIGLPDLSILPAVAGAHLGGVHRIVSSWNRGMRKVARQTGAHFLDLSQYAAELATHPDYISRDGLHPSNRGYARLAQVIVAAVRRDGLWPAR